MRFVLCLIAVVVTDSHNFQSTHLQAESNARILRISMQDSATWPQLHLRGGIGEALDGETNYARGISNALETFESFGDGPKTLDASSSRLEAMPDYFNQSENRMDGNR